MQRRNLIVELIAAFVEAAQALRERLFDESFVDVTVAGFFGGIGQLLDQIQQAACVAVGVTHDGVARLIRNIL